MSVSQMLLSVGLFSLAVSACATNPITCAEINMLCVQEGNYAVYDSMDTSADETAALLNVMLSAAMKFEEKFGKAPQPTAIVTGGLISQSDSAALKAHGHVLDFPWVTESQRDALVRESIEAQIAALPEAMKEQVRSAALSKAKPEALSQEKLDGALAHELGHIWFIEAFGPSHSTESGHAYGGWAPDWLDEAAAVSLENEALKASRRETFKDLQSEERIPLDEFLTMEHPSAKAGAELARAKALIGGETADGASRAIILSGDEADAFLKASGGDRAVVFYAQTLAFTEYLMSASGDKTILADIAQKLSTGGGFSDWLATQGPNYGLPSTIDSLKAEWANWGR